MIDLLTIIPQDGTTALLIDGGSDINNTGFINWSIDGSEQVSIQGYLDDTYGALFRVLVGGVEHFRLDSDGRLYNISTLDVDGYITSATLNATNLFQDGNAVLDDSGFSMSGSINMSSNDLLELGQLKDSSTIEKIGNGNLIAYWNFDNPSYVSSSLTLDSSMNENEGTITGATLTTGKYGQGYEFDGDNDYISFSDTGNISTVSIWYYSKLVNNQQIILVAGTNNVNVIHHRSNGNIGCYDASREGWDSPYDMPQDEWVHIVHVWDESLNQYQQYINGEYNADLNCSQDSTSGMSGPTTNSINGTIDEVMIFNISLSANEIQALYSQGSYRQDPYIYRAQSIIKKIHYVEVGDGNDIQTKINDCGSSGCLIMIPNGDYYINDTITLSNKGITLKGNSFGGGKYSTGGSVRIFADSGMAGKNMVNITNERIQLENLILDGNNITNDGITMYSSAGSILITHVQSKQQGRNGIFAENNMMAGNLLFHVITSENGLHGAEIQRNDWRIIDYYSFRNWNGAALMLNEGSGIQVNNIHSFYNKYGVYMNGTDASSFTNIVLEQNNHSAYYFDSTHSDIKRISLIGGIHYLNDINDTGEPLIYFNADTNDIDGVTIVGNNMDDSIHIFNYSESNDGEIKNIQFSSNIYEAELGDYPETVYFGIEQDVSSQGLVSGMNFNTESITGSAGSEIILDSSTENNHGTNNGATHNSSGGFNTGGAFEFTNDYIEIAKEDSLNFDKNDFTISMWIKGTYTSNYHYLLHRRTAYQTNEIEFKFWGDGSLEFSTDNTAGGEGEVHVRDTSYFLTDNKWYHVVGVRQNDTLYIYVNGEIKDSQSGTIQNITSQENLFVASNADTNGHYFNGSIDELKMWNRALSFNEIEFMYLQRTEILDSYVNQKYVYVDSDGKVGIGTNSLSTILNVNGTITSTSLGTGILQLTANTTSVVCNTSNAGNIYYNGGDYMMYFCNSTDWRAMG